MVCLASSASSIKLSVHMLQNLGRGSEGKACPKGPSPFCASHCDREHQQ